MKTATSVVASSVQDIAKRQTAIIEVIKKIIASGHVDTKDMMASIGQLEQVGLRTSILSRFSSIALGQVFQFLKESWEAFPITFTQAYPTAYDYIREKFGYGDQMTDLYAAVWEAWFSGKYQFAKPDFIKIERLPVVKLRVAAPYVMRGEMDKHRWKLLADETLTRSELTQGLRTGKPQAMSKGKNAVPKGSGTDVVFVRETGDLRLYNSNGEPVQVGFLNISSSDPLVLDAIRNILSSAGIRSVR